VIVPLLVAGADACKTSHRDQQFNVRHAMLGRQEFRRGTSQARHVAESVELPSSVFRPGIRQQAPPRLWCVSAPSSVQRQIATELANMGRVSFLSVTESRFDLENAAGARPPSISPSSFPAGRSS
jgi:hypothetical protein